MAQRQFRDDDTDVWADRYGAGTDGALTVSANTTDSTPNTTLTGTSGTKAATVGSGTGFSNGDLVLIHQSQGTGAGAWELNKIASGGGTTSWGLAYNLTNTYGTGAQVYKLFQYSSATINTGVTLTGQTWNGSQGGVLAILCDGTITVNGAITLQGLGYRGGAGNINDNSYGQQGEGTPGVGGQSNAANGTGGGGNYKASGSQNSGSGGGGNATSGGNGGNNGSSAGGVGGSSAGVAALTSMVFGGASGGMATGGNGTGFYTGMNGSGIVILIGKTIDTSSSTGIVVDGVSSTGSNNNGSVGGSAGGSILLKGQALTLGTNKATAQAGTAFATVATGGVGSVGRIHADYSTSISGSTNPTIDSATQKVLADLASGGLFFAQL